MPHDLNGKVLKVGDIVNIPCKVIQIQLGTDYCNISLETLYKMPPENKYTSSYTLNTKQIEFVSREERNAASYEDQVKVNG